MEKFASVDFLGAAQAPVFATYGKPTKIWELAPNGVHERVNEIVKEKLIVIILPGAFSDALTQFSRCPSNQEEKRYSIIE